MSLILCNGMACQTIKTLKINQGNGLLQKRLSVSVQFWHIIKQKEMLKTLGKCESVRV